ncbi:MAG: hypothetical protein KGL39_45515 [Patescibacteria group bacterium]|nr:hypothetical protein [Patescibacteria group bacterium]
MNYHDLAALDESFSGLANTILRNRVMAEQQKERQQAAGVQQQDLGLRRQMLEQQIARENSLRQYEADRLAETKRHNQSLEGGKDEGKVDAYLQGPEGAVMHFAGPKSSLDKMMEGAAAQGKPLKQVEKPDVSDAYATITKDTPNGKFTFHPRNAQEFDAITTKLKAFPSVPATRPADVEKDTAAADLEGQAAKTTDEAMKKDLLARAAALRSGIGRPDPTEYETQTQVLERDPDTGRSVRTVQRKVKAGQSGAGAASPMKLPNAKKDLQKGKVYQTARGAATWDGAQFIPLQSANP